MVTASAAADQKVDEVPIGEQDDSADKPRSKPRYHINDNSYVNVTVASSEFQTSMATNDFSSHNTEASVGGGFGGFAASVSGAYGASKSNENVQTDSVYMKTMIAKYMVGLTLRCSYILLIIWIVTQSHDLPRSI